MRRKTSAVEGRRCLAEDRPNMGRIVRKRRGEGETVLCHWSDARIPPSPRSRGPASDQCHANLGWDSRGLAVNFTEGRGEPVIGPAGGLALRWVRSIVPFVGG